MSERAPRSILCAACGYDLTGLPPTGACPECAYSIDDSIRVAGEWTGPRLLRLRRVASWTVVMAAAWCIAGGITIPTWWALGPGRESWRYLIICMVVVHTLALAGVAIGGTYAASRQPSGRRQVLMIALAVSLALAGGCFGMALGGTRAFQRAFENGGFVAALLVRAVNIQVAAWWLRVGWSRVAPDRRVVGATPLIGAWTIIGVWLLFWCLLLAEGLHWFRLGWPRAVPAVLTLTVDSAALVAIGVSAFALRRVPVLRAAR